MYLYIYIYIKEANNPFVSITCNTKKTLKKTDLTSIERASRKESLIMKVLWQFPMVVGRVVGRRGEGHLSNRNTTINNKSLTKTS